IYSIVLILALLVVYLYRKGEANDPIYLEGTTMATTYHITYFDKKGRNFKPQVDSLLILVNKSINTYDPQSEVSIFNNTPVSFKIGLPYLLPPLKVARKVFD